jgi:hypothetical protein
MPEAGPCRRIALSACLSAQKHLVIEQSYFEYPGVNDLLLAEYVGQNHRVTFGHDIGDIFHDEFFLGFSEHVHIEFTHILSLPENLDCLQPVLTRLPG